MPLPLLSSGMTDGIKTGSLGDGWDVGHLWAPPCALEWNALCASPLGSPDADCSWLGLGGETGLAHSHPHPIPCPDCPISALHPTD